MKILGIDPSLTSSGWVLLEDNKLIDYGLIKTTTETKKRFTYIYKSFKELINKYKPDEVHVETPFEGRNKQVGLKLSYIRGFIILICEEKNINLVSFSPQEIKKQITGSGKAEKEEVANKLNEIFRDDDMFKAIGPFSDKNNKNKTSDIYDALAVAHCVKK